MGVSQSKKPLVQEKKAECLATFDKSVDFEIDIVDVVDKLLGLNAKGKVYSVYLTMDCPATLHRRSNGMHNGRLLYSEDAGILHRNSRVYYFIAEDL